MSDKSLTPVSSSLSLDPEITKKLEKYEDFVSYYIGLSEFTTSFSWTKADLLLLLSQRFGDSSLSQFASEVGMPKSTVINYVRAARAFPSDKRLPNVSFTHHLRASMADPIDKEGNFTSDNRFEWIARAADEKMSVLRLDSQIYHAELQVISGKKSPPCDRCGEYDGEIKQYVFFCPGRRKRSTKLELHERCEEKIIEFAQAGKLEGKLNEK